MKRIRQINISFAQMHIYMSMLKKFVLLSLVSVTLCTHSFAWGKKGHEIVAEVAFHYLDDTTRKLVTNFLSDMSIEEAATWMDDSRSNNYYDYMKTWHYLDLDKGQKYNPSSEKNILIVLHSAIAELRNYKSMKKKDIKNRLLLIFHLVGDLHQPLHTGYAVDRGGNDVDVNSKYVNGNLHSIWDTQIIDYAKINKDSAIAVYPYLDSSVIKDINNINEMKWMYQSRYLLDTVYDFKNKTLDLTYINKNALIIKKQLLIGGLRLAVILKELFNPTSKLVTQ